MKILQAFGRFVLLLTIQTVVAAEDDQYEKMLYPDLIEMEYLFNFGIELRGSAEVLVTSRDDLISFTKLQCKNLLSKIQQKPLPFDDDGVLPEGYDRDEWYAIKLDIWTVGEDYPVAYHVTLSLTKVGNRQATYMNSILGYSSAKELIEKRGLKTAIADLVESAAITVYKVTE